METSVSCMLADGVNFFTAAPFLISKMTFRKEAEMKKETLRNINTKLLNKNEGTKL